MSGTPTISPLHDSSHRPLLKSGLMQRVLGSGVSHPPALIAGEPARNRRETRVLKGPNASGRPRIELRSDADVAALANAGALAASVLEVARRACVIGATTAEIDQAAHAAILAGGGEPLFLGYRGASSGGANARPAFPAATCISVNEQLVHGVPGPRVVRDGDLVSIDVGVRLDGWCADSAITVCVGNVDSKSRALVACAESMLDHAIAAAVPGRRWSAIARELELIAEQANFSIAVDFVGHGIGRQLHEPPQVPCSAYQAFCDLGDFTLRPGMVLAIEPMLVLEAPQRNEAGGNVGELRSPACSLASDGWTVTVNSGQPSCHCEHTVVITRDGARILTAPLSARVGSGVAGVTDYRKAG